MMLESLNFCTTSINQQKIQYVNVYMYSIYFEELPGAQTHFALFFFNIQWPIMKYVSAVPLNHLDLLDNILSVSLPNVMVMVNGL